MFAIIIQEKGGEQRRLEFDKPEVTIGRVQGNDIVLPKGNVSKRHARIVLKDGKFIIVDLKSTNGTYVNGRKITSPLVVKESDKIYIGDFIMGVDDGTGSGIAASTPDPAAGRFEPPSTGGGGAPPPPRFDGNLGGGTERPDRPVERPERPAGRADLPPPTPDRAPPPPHASGASPELLRAALQRQEPPRPAPLADPRSGGDGEREAPARPGASVAPPPAIPPRPAAREPAPMPAPMPPREPVRAPERSPEPLAAPAPYPPAATPIGPMPAVGVGIGLGGAPLAAAAPIAPLAGSPIASTTPGGPGAGVIPPGINPVPSTSPPGAVRAPRPGGTMPPPTGASPTIPAPIGAPASGPVMVPASAPPTPSLAPGAPGTPPLSTGATISPITSARGANPGTNPEAAAWAPRAEAARRAPRRLALRPVPPAGRRGLHLPSLDDKTVKLLDLQTQILERLRAKLDLDHIAVERLGDEELWQKAERAIVDLVETLESSNELPAGIEQDTLIKETLNEALGLGPLEDLLADESIDEIIVDRRDRVVVGKAGVLRPSGKAFSSDDVLRRVVERLVAPTGQALGDDAPVIDVRLRDGSRLTAALPPVATQGACLVLRKPRAETGTLADLVGAGAMSPAMKDLLTTSITARRNVLVCGGVDAGKTRVVGALARTVPRGERIVTVEDVAELALDRDEWISLETRGGATGAIDRAQLVQAALRLRPDRLVVGDVGGAEAFALAAALGSSIDGALVSVTGEGATSALGRLAVLARLGAQGAGDDAVREIVASAFDLVVHVARFPGGVVRVVAIDEVVGVSDAAFETQPLFVWRGEGSGAGFAATGSIPRFYGELESRGMPADLAIFKT